MNYSHQDIKKVMDKIIEDKRRYYELISIIMNNTFKSAKEVISMLCEDAQLLSVLDSVDRSASQYIELFIELMFRQDYQFSSGVSLQEQIDRVFGHVKEDHFEVQDSAFEDLSGEYFFWYQEPFQIFKHQMPFILRRDYPDSLIVRIKGYDPSTDIFQVIVMRGESDGDTFEVGSKWVELNTPKG